MSEPTLKKVQLVINKMTREQYSDLSARGEISPDQLYLLPEDGDVKPVWGNITGNLEDQEDLADKFAEIDESTGDLDERITGVSEELGQLREDVELSASSLDTKIEGVAEELDTQVETLEEEIATKATRNNIAISYSDTTKKITLNADGHSTEIDAQDFIKDGMVESARYDAAAKKIIITFNTDAGKSPISVDVAALIHEYSAGTGLELSGNVFSVDDTIATKEYVNTAASGTLQDAEEYTDSKIVQVRTELANVSAEIEGDIPTKLSELDNDVGYLSAHQSLSAYAKKTELDSKVNKDNSTNAQYVRIYKAFDLDKNAIELNVGSHSTRPSIVVEYRDAENELTLPEKNGTIAVTTDIPTKVSQLKNDAGYLSAHQSLTAYATKDELSDYAPINSPHFVGDVWVNDWDNIVRKNGQSLEGRLGDFLTQNVAERDYAKLSSIPTVNNPEIILKQGDVEKGRFTLNQATGATITFEEPGDDAAWGNITGDISAQEDLSEILADKASLSGDNLFLGHISVDFDDFTDPKTVPLSSMMSDLDNPMWLRIVTRMNSIIRLTRSTQAVLEVNCTVQQLIEKAEDVSIELGYGPIPEPTSQSLTATINEVIDRLNLILDTFQRDGVSLSERLRDLESQMEECIFYSDLTREKLGEFATKTYVDNQVNTRATEGYVNEKVAPKADLSAIGNGTVIIKQGGVEKGRFTLNQSTGTTINLSAGGGAGGNAVWGQITGEITSQTDLAEYVASGSLAAIEESQAYTDSQVSSKTDTSTVVGLIAAEDAAVKQWVGDQGYQNAQQVQNAIATGTSGLATYLQLTAAVDAEDQAIKQYIEDQHHINSQQAQQLIDTSIQSKADVSSLSDYAVKSNVGISYNSTTHIITLNADGHTTTVNASDFIKDGMVENAVYDSAHKQMIITFNTDAGKTPISVDVSDLVKEYTAGTGLVLNGSQFSLSSSVALKTDIGNGKITINQGGVKKGEFTLNQASNLTVDLSAGGSGGDVSAGYGLDKNGSILSVNTDIIPDKVYIDEAIATAARWNPCTIQGYDANGNLSTFYFLSAATPSHTFDFEPMQVTATDTLGNTSTFYILTKETL